MFKVLAGLVLVLLFAFSAIPGAIAGEITFISSEEDLIEAVNLPKIKGIAIRSEFYNSAGLSLKIKIEYTVNTNINKLVPIFFYGYDIDRAAFNKLIYKKLAYDCDPIIIAGYFGTIPLNSQDFRGQDIKICIFGAIFELGSSEDWFREWIEYNWLVWKEEYRALGYATLN